MNRETGPPEIFVCFFFAIKFINRRVAESRRKMKAEFLKFENRLCASAVKISLVFNLSGYFQRDFMPQLKIDDDATPAELGYHFPAEWEMHAATWLGWPHNASDWPGKFETIPWVYGEMVRKISAGEKIYLLIRNKQDENFARKIFKLVGVDLRKISFVTHPTNRGWTRDTGPIFVKRSPKSKVQSPKSETAIVHFHFNGWAKYDNWRKDTKVPETAARVLGKKLFHAECRSGKPSLSLKAAGLN